MAITVTLPAVLARLADGNKELSADGVTVGEVIDALSPFDILRSPRGYATMPASHIHSLYTTSTMRTFASVTGLRHPLLTAMK